ncbi:GNAT family N-acetyltransferase [Pseudomonas sp. 5P_3.1_Bac2]|uniref:GNAT family N-acetyltransferase n=1 Tax=Pseudomonas sp. 5P_3.1_Bac2 TaxID=2971617 RepID=UPI0021CA5CFF|nr:GNAT family N-acetyltransferase [Pseudomonas sp. 5P_3.1_Bac2]MCU1719008.1 GNAT family N-acetyltransferase [Pseudomonas sp. 5P_3.1_Bac2]
MTTAQAILTPRLRLRQWQDSDYAPFAALNADPEVMRYFPAPLSQAQSDAIANRCHELIAARGWGFWALEALSSGAFIGFLGLHIPDADLPCSPCVEIGWRLAQPYWGQGLAHEAAQAALAYGFNQLQLAQIVAFTSVHNLRSQALMQRLNMQREAANFEHPAVPVGHWLREHCLYRLDATQAPLAIAVRCGGQHSA